MGGNQNPPSGGRLNQICHKIARGVPELELPQNYRAESRFNDRQGSRICCNRKGIIAPVTVLFSLSAALHTATHDQLFDIVIKRCGAGVSPPASLPSPKRSRFGCAHAGRAPRYASGAASLWRSSMCSGCAAGTCHSTRRRATSHRSPLHCYTVALEFHRSAALATEGVTILLVSPEGCSPSPLLAAAVSGRISLRRK